MVLAMADLGPAATINHHEDHQGRDENQEFFQVELSSGLQESL